jgi:hypothetical protein
VKTAAAIATASVLIIALEFAIMHKYGRKPGPEPTAISHYLTVDSLGELARRTGVLKVAVDYKLDPNDFMDQLDNVAGRK